MRKIFVILKREYLAMVATKGFIVGLVLLPVMMVGGGALPRLLATRVDLGDKTIVVVDETGRLFEPLQAAVAQRNQAAIFDAQKRQTAPRYLLEEKKGPLDDLERLKLSDQARAKQIHAFVEIPAAAAASDAATASPPASYYADNAAVSDVRNWFQQALSAIVRSQRFRESGISAEVVDRASRPVEVDGLGLYVRTASGEIKKAEKTERVFAMLFPLIVMMLMFMPVWMTGQSVLECVMEEKQQRIGEVLLGSADPFQLMAGKLAGCVAGSLTIVVCYLGGGAWLAWYNGYLERVPLDILPWLVVFQVLLMIIVSSAFLAVAAAVNDLKEAGGLLLPVWLVLMAPMFVWFNVVREPNGGLATLLSFIPPLTPLVMVLRLAASDAVPVWQPFAGAATVIATSVLIVFAAARIFRIGLLSQGKAPTFRQLARWALSG